MAPPRACLRWGQWFMPVGLTLAAEQRVSSESNTPAVRQRHEEREQRCQESAEDRGDQAGVRAQAKGGDQPTYAGIDSVQRKEADE